MGRRILPSEKDYETGPSGQRVESAVARSLIPDNPKDQDVLERFSTSRSELRLQPRNLNRDGDLVHLTEQAYPSA
jgi:hypothetical protein